MMEYAHLAREFVAVDSPLFTVAATLHPSPVAWRPDQLQAYRATTRSALNFTQAALARGESHPRKAVAAAAPYSE